MVVEKKPIADGFIEIKFVNGTQADLEAAKLSTFMNMKFVIRSQTDRLTWTRYYYVLYMHDYVFQ